MHTRGHLHIYPAAISARLLYTGRSCHSQDDISYIAMLGETSRLESKTHLSERKTRLRIQVKSGMSQTLTAMTGFVEHVGRHAKKHDRPRLENTFGPWGALPMFTQPGRYYPFLGLLHCCAGTIPREDMMRSSQPIRKPWIHPSCRDRASLPAEAHYIYERYNRPHMHSLHAPSASDQELKAFTLLLLWATSHGQPAPLAPWPLESLQGTDPHILWTCTP